MLPSWVAPSQRFFFALYEDGKLCYYKEEKEPPQLAECHGKLDMKTVTTAELFGWTRDIEIEMDAARTAAPAGIPRQALRV